MKLNNAIFQVSKQLLQNNYLYLLKKIGNPIMSVIKGNAYGIGMKEAFLALCEARCALFAVAYEEEAIILEELILQNKLNINISILILNEFSSSYSRNSNVNFVYTAYDINQVKQLKQQDNKQIALFFDTGFTRLGIKWQQAEEVANILNEKKVSPKLVLSHLCNAYANKSSKLFLHNDVQYKRFTKAIQYFPNALKSLTNSSASFIDKKYIMDFARTGKSLYGLMDIEGLKQVFSLKAKILQVNEITEGDSVGYNQTFVAKRSMKVATISAGYHDGVPLQFSYSNLKDNYQYQHFCTIICNNKNYYAPIIGQISMDTVTVDVTDLKDLHSYNLNELEVEILGPNNKNHISYSAIKSNSNINAILQNIGNRVYRTMV